MIIVEKFRDYAENIDIKESLANTLESAKGYINRALGTVRSMTKLDVAICSAVTATVGTIFAAIFSKTFKKLFSVTAALCGVGAVYLLYRKYFKD